MLLRFVVENVLSFKEATEFNTFPSSRTHSHEWHKMQCGHVTSLCLGAIYGANGAGKSNLLKCISMLKDLVVSGKISETIPKDGVHFKLDPSEANKPSEMAIEFYASGKVFYYHLAFSQSEVIEEELIIAGKDKDENIFCRKKDAIEVNEEFLKEGKKDGFGPMFMDAMNRIIKGDMLALSFFGQYYADELPIVNEAFDWIRQLQVVLPTMRIGYLPHALDKDEGFCQLVQKLMPKLKTGIKKLTVRKEELKEDVVSGNPALAEAIAEARRNPGVPQIMMAPQSNEISNVVVEDGKAVRKSLVAIHSSLNGKEVEMGIDSESDGTRRLIEYMPLLYGVLNKENVFIVDEIERSIHPIIIKALMETVSESKEIKGQIIFTTHESCLLDQSIFRPDEIWFAQKDVEQATQMYPLSDYNIHKTANIENGYLNGRYGGVPFLSNPSDLNWL
ncbi:MAG: ATP-binding protein [Bacteroidales bacterium]|nr:ATP-binding protein [Bacteroidales bacterium]